MAPNVFSPLFDLVTGGTRGAGRETVLALVRAGRPNVMFVYRQKEQRALELVEEAQAINSAVNVVAVKCDITDPEELRKLTSALLECRGYLSSVFLVASGGLERGMPDNYPMMMNKDAQLSVITTCWKYLAFRARIVYDTSHWAHLYGSVVQLPGYEPIAASKNAGEKELLQLVSELEGRERREVTFVTVTGDMLVDSMVIRLMERQNPGTIDQRRKEAGIEDLPTYRTFGQANVDTLLDPYVRHKDVIVVGGSLDTLTPLEQ